LTEADNRTCAEAEVARRSSRTRPHPAERYDAFPTAAAVAAQPANVKPLLAVAVRVIEVPAVKFAEHVEESQFRPGGDDFTWPLR